MRLIKSIEVYELKIPRRWQSTASPEPLVNTHSVLTKITSVDNQIGYGEACVPANISMAAIVSFYQQYGTEILENIHDVASLYGFHQEHHHRIDNHPQSWCAAELAILDLLGKYEQQNVAELLGLAAHTQQFCYSAILPLLADHNIVAQLIEYYNNENIEDYKVILHPEMAISSAHLNLLKQHDILGERLRLVANNYWQNPDSCYDALSQFELPFIAIEEPLAIQDFTGLRALQRALNVPIILNTSFSKLHDFSYIRSDPHRWIINLNISAIGGLLNAITIADQADELKIPLIIGANGDETSLLTRAAQLLCSHAQLVHYHEGALSTLFLSEDIFMPNIKMGQFGWVDLTLLSLQSYGFGIKYRENSAAHGVFSV